MAKLLSARGALVGHGGLYRLRRHGVHAPRTTTSSAAAPRWTRRWAGGPSSPTAPTTGAVTLTSPESAAVKASPGTVSGFSDAALAYRTARVFAAPSSYAFAIRPPRPALPPPPLLPLRERRRLRPLRGGQGVQGVHAGRRPARPRLAVAQRRRRRRGVVVEFLLDVARDTLLVTFVPLADGGVAFVNALEVVSVPDDLLTKAGAFLFRCKRRTASTYNGTLNRVAGQATVTDAPDYVYNTARELVLTNGSTLDGMKQMVWKFDVDAQSAYLIRFHFCDIVSKAPGQLRMNAYARRLPRDSRPRPRRRRRWRAGIPLLHGLRVAC
ncbi:hypothetical protein ACQ4PT_002953 [Festuca glaucescens]